MCQIDTKVSRALELRSFLWSVKLSENDQIETKTARLRRGTRPSRFKPTKRGFTAVV
jgi:hypothetical protein